MMTPEELRAALKRAEDGKELHDSHWRFANGPFALKCHGYEPAGVLSLGINYLEDVPKLVGHIDEQERMLRDCDKALSGFDSQFHADLRKRIKEALGD